MVRRPAWVEAKALPPRPPKPSDEQYAWWPPARPRAGDTETRYVMRLAAAEALHLPPRDPRFWEPHKELGWDNTAPLYGRFIPTFETNGGDQVNCMGHIEPFIRRPVSRPRSDFVTARMAMGRRTSPLLSYNSLGWNRRQYEPMPDVARVSPPKPSLPASAASTRSGSYSAGYSAASEMGCFDPPRIEGVDTHSRPPLVVHSTGKMRRPAWIGTRY